MISADVREAQNFKSSHVSGLLKDRAASLDFRWLNAEINEKQARSIKYQLTIAKLPLAKDLDDFQFERHADQPDASQ
ncbi:hypothetical protein ABIC07_009512 [Bradyrhizobium sp. RT9a]